MRSIAYKQKQYKDCIEEEKEGDEDLIDIILP
jgi:hypothetical protein